MRAPELIINLSPAVKIRAVYSDATDLFPFDYVFYSYIDGKDESNESEDLIGVLREENPRRSTDETNDLAIEVLLKVKPWLGEILNLKEEQS